MAEKQNIQAIADLACLKIEDKDLGAFEGHFEKILEYFSTLQGVDTTGIDPMITPHGTQSSLRSDQVKQELSVDEILENAPEVKDSLFKVPPVV